MLLPESLLAFDFFFNFFFYYSLPIFSYREGSYDTSFKVLVSRSIIHLLLVLSLGVTNAQKYFYPNESTLYIVQLIGFLSVSFYQDNYYLYPTTYFGDSFSYIC